MLTAASPSPSARPTSAAVMEARLANFQNRNLLNTDEFRRRRGEAVVEIRKQKRQESLTKRRNLGSISMDDAEDHAFFQVASAQTGLESLLVSIRASDTSLQLDAVVKIRKLLSRAKDPPIQELIELGVVPLLVSFLVGSDPLMQFEAAWALTNIASGNSTQTEVVIESGAIPHLIRLVRSNNPDVKEQAVWALGNIAGDSTTNRDLILTSGAVPELTEILYNQAFRISTLRIAVWAISNLCRGKNPLPDWRQIAPALPAIANLVYSMDEDILIDTCWTLAYMASGPNERIQCVIEARVIPRLIQLLEHDSADVKTPALRAIGSIVTGDDLQTQMVIDSGVLPGLARLLLVPTADYTKDACWVISNITAGTIDQIDAVVNANVMVPLIEVLRKGDFRTKREACWAVCNATMGWLQKPEHVRYLVQQGVIKPLCDLLRVNDAKVAKIVLEALENILRVGEMDRRITGGENEYAEHIDAAGGMDQINKLQSHSNIDIYQKCFNIIEKYYGEDAEDRLSEPVLSASGMYDFKTEIAAGEHFSF